MDIAKAYMNIPITIDNSANLDLVLKKIIDEKKAVYL
jgi:hypothetical protein